LENQNIRLVDHVNCQPTEIGAQYISNCV